MIKTLILSSKENVIEHLTNNIKRSVNTIITTFKFGNDIIDYIEQYKPEVIILDIDLQGINGIELFQKLKTKNSRAHKILFSNKNEDYIKVAAYDAGVDYFLTEKETDRVFRRKIIQIYDRLLNEKNQIYYNSLIIDTSRFQITYLDKHYTLPKKQFLIYALLCKHPGKVYSREEIYENVWKHKMQENSRTLDVHIREIRKSLPNNKIKTLSGVGYKVEDINREEFY
jgi:DNA-binding response OmpR family regulator